MKIKSLLITAVLATAILCCGPANTHAAKATTAADCLSVVGGTNYSTDERISCLQDLITQLMAQIKNLQSQQSTTQNWCHTFNTNLGIDHVADNELGALWTALSKEGFNVQAGKFDETTASAVTGFQEKYASEILAPYGLKHGTGFVGVSTRKKLNSLYRCITQSECKIDSDCPQMTSTGTALFPINKCIDGRCVLTQCNTDSDCPQYKCSSFEKCIGSMNKCIDGKCINTPTQICNPNWTCSWGPCKNGWQSYVITDSNNCGLSASNVNIACPALAQQCPIQSSINVLSPNGGETWQKGTIQTIKWQDNIPVPECPPGAYCAQVARFYDIKLVQLRPYCPPCVAGAVCVACSMPVPYTIATSVSGYSYSWGVGKILSNYLSTPAPDGAYTVQICQTGTDICDSSDSYFKITSSASTNLPPVISGGIAPTTLNVNQTGTWTINASDPENGPLNYSVNWGDAIIAPISYSASAQSAFIQTSTFTHSYSSAGIYTVTFTVQDNAGLTAQTSSTVQVGNSTQPSTCTGEGGSIPVIVNPPACCPGLILIKPMYSGLVGSSGICTAKCGNGVCDNTTETNYNCPQDCSSIQPSITSLSTNSGGPGTTVTIYGSNFGSNSDPCFANTIWCADNIQSITPSQIVFTLNGNLIPGAYQLFVMNIMGVSDHQISNSVPFTIVAP